MSNEISFTPAKRDALRVAYNKAVADGAGQFTFEGHELVTGYAKYVLQHLDNQFGKPIPLDHNVEGPYSVWPR